MTKVKLSRERPARKDEVLVIEVDGRRLRIKLDLEDWMNLESLARAATTRLNAVKP